MSAAETISTPLPDDAALVTARLVCIAYVRDDGSRGYTVHADGDEPMTSYLGLTLVAQDHIKEWGQA